MNWRRARCWLLGHRFGACEVRNAEDSTLYGVHNGGIVRLGVARCERCGDQHVAVVIAGGPQDLAHPQFADWEREAMRRQFAEHERNLLDRLAKRWTPSWWGVS